MASPMKGMEGVPKQVKELLKAYPELQFHSDTNKIKCSLSGHEMPCKEDAITSYVKGKKFLKLRNDREFNYDKLKPHIVPSIKRRHEHQLFCLLTLRHINRFPKEVEKHLHGRKYKRELERWKTCQKTGDRFIPLSAQKRKREPDISTAGGKDFLDSDHDSEDSMDSLSDLYPREKFGNMKSDDDADDISSDFEFEKMETQSENKSQKHSKKKGDASQNNSSKLKKPKKKNKLKKPKTS